MSLSLDFDTFVFLLVNFVVIGLAGWFLKKWLATSLNTRSAKQVEELRATLQQDNQVAITELRDKLEQNTHLQLSAHASYAAAHEAAAGKRLECAELLWKELLRFRNSLPPILTIIDLVTEQELPDVLESPNGKEFIRNLSLESVVELTGIDVSQPLEEIRPFVNENLWQRFARYRAIQARILLHLVWFRDGKSTTFWYHDAFTKQLIEDSLSADELETLDQLKVGKIRYVREMIEAKLLEELRRMISGESSGSESFQQARRLQSLAREELLEPSD